MRIPATIFGTGTIIAVLLAACSTTDKPQTAGNAVDADGLPILSEEQKAEGIVCVREPVTGSRISRKSCTTQEQRERNKRLAEEELNKVTRQKPGPVAS
jgi:uncharacterized protein with ACT and thioredoxin-like domain